MKKIIVLLSMVIGSLYAISCTTTDDVNAITDTGDKAVLDSISSNSDSLLNIISALELELKTADTSNYDSLSALINTYTLELSNTDVDNFDSLQQIINSLKLQSETSDSVMQDSLQQIINSLKLQSETADSLVKDSLANEIGIIQEKLDSLLIQDFNVIIQGRILDYNGDIGFGNEKVELLERALTQYTSIDDTTTLDIDEAGQFSFILPKASKLGPFTILVNKKGYTPVTKTVPLIDFDAIYGDNSLPQTDYIEDVGIIYIKKTSFADSVQDIATAKNGITFNITDAKSNINRQILSASPMYIYFNRPIDTTYSFGLTVENEYTGETVSYNNLSYSDYMQQINFAPAFKDGYAYNFYITHIWGLAANDKENVLNFADYGFSNKWVITYKSGAPSATEMIIPSFDTTSVIIAFDEPIKSNSGTDLRVTISTGLGGQYETLGRFEYGQYDSTTNKWRKYTPKSGFANAIRYYDDDGENQDYDIKDKVYYLDDNIKDYQGYDVDNLEFNSGSTEKLPVAKTSVAN